MVVVDIAPAENERDALVLVVENVGPTIARNVRIAATPPPIRSFDPPDKVPLHDWRVFAHGIATLPPRGRMVYLFDIASRRFNAPNMPMRYEFVVTAQGPFGAATTLVYDVDLEPLSDAWAGQVTIKDVITAIKDTNNALGDIAKAVGRD